MSVDQLRLKAQQRQSKARFETVVSIIVGLTLSVLFAWTFVTAKDLFLRIGFGILILWCLYYAWQAYKWTWPRPSGPDATWNATLESYRTELEKRRDYVRHIWRRAGLTVCFFGMALIMVPELVKALGNPRHVWNVAPLLVLLVIWLAIFIPQRKRRQQSLQQEIEELRLFEKQTQA